MRKTMLLMLLCALVTPLLAQDMPGPPKVLQIIREDVKPGKAYMHTQHEAQWTRAMMNAKFDTPMLALTATTGANEAWFLEGYESWAAFEKDGDRLMKNASLRSIMESNTAKESDYVQESRTMIAVFRPELSYHPNINVGEYRYFTVRTSRVKLGQDIGELMKVVNDARERAGWNFSNAVYEVVSGAPTGTFLSFHALKSLSEMDTNAPQAYSDALKEANFTDVASKVIATTDTRVFEFSPEMSAAPATWIAANPSFWKPKAMGMKAEVPAAKKEPAAPPKK